MPLLVWEKKGSYQIKLHLLMNIYPMHEQGSFRPSFGILSQKKK